MGRHKYRKREKEKSEDIFQSGEGLLDAVKNLTKKGATKLSQKVGEKVGRKLVDSAFKKTARRSPEKSSKSGELISKLYQSPENSGDENFKILSTSSKQKPKQSTGQSPKQISQQEINERLNMLMNM